MSAEQPKSGLGVRWEVEAPAETAAAVRERHEANRASWNEGAVAYAAKVEETIAALRAGKSSLHPVERRNLGDLRSWCGVAIHLQCASGEDTLSLWLEGAGRVVGVDIADAQIANARQTSEALGAPASWYCCDVLEVPDELHGTADLVYTGQGAINWLHDLERWAGVVFQLLKPGGMLHIFDGHPLTWLFEQDAETYVYSGVDYFAHSETSRGWPSTYIGDVVTRPHEAQAAKHERLWTLAAIVGAVLRAGLVIEQLGEHPDEYWRDFPNLRPEVRGRVPLTFSLIARRPQG